ncbi:lytic transglycosylase domain-containing protein [Spirillospora sp. NPDC052269]
MPAPSGTGTKSPRRRPRLAAVGVGVLVAGSIAGGVYGVLTVRSPEPARRDAAATASPDPLRNGPVANLDTARGQVAPLRRVVPPDVLAVGGTTITRAQVAKIAKVGHVKDVIAVAGGAVQLQGRQVNAFAVDPSVFRSWTPPGTAKRTELWNALAADQFVVSSNAADQLQLSRGFQYPVVGRTVPNLVLGGSGNLGLPGIDMLVSTKSGTGMGLVDDIAVLVNAPGANPGKVAGQVKRILGAGASAVNLHETKYQPSGQGGKAGSYLDLYRRAATTCPGLSWTVLAAIGQVESDHGRNPGRSSAGALGPMQFLPSTWATYGVDGDGDGKADIMNPYDAIPAAAKYLCANGAGKGGQSLYRAIFAYNHADWYVQKVLGLARAYAAQYR